MRIVVLILCLCASAAAQAAATAPSQSVRIQPGAVLAVKQLPSGEIEISAETATVLPQLGAQFNLAKDGTWRFDLSRRLHAVVFRNGVRQKAGLDYAIAVQVLIKPLFEWSDDDLVLADFFP